MWEGSYLPHFKPAVNLLADCSLNAVKCCALPHLPVCPEIQKDWIDKVRFSTCLTPQSTKNLQTNCGTEAAHGASTLDNSESNHKTQSCRTYDSWRPSAHWTGWCYVVQTSFPSAAPPRHCRALDVGCSTVGRAARGHVACVMISRDTTECQEGWFCGYVVRPRPRKSVSTITFFALSEASPLMWL